MWSDCRHRDCAKVRWRGLPSPVEQILAIRSLGPTTRIHLAITIFLATRICARQPSCSVGGRIALCSGPRPQPFADDPIFFGRIALLRILPAVAELISAGNHSRNPRTHHRRQPAGPMASPYACGDRIFDAALMRARSINHEGHEGTPRKIRGNKSRSSGSQSIPSCLLWFMQSLRIHPQPQNHVDLHALLSAKGGAESPIRQSGKNFR